MKITKAIIPAAGYGTRFLPYTKAIPKEMLPIIDKPVIQYVVEEAVQSGIKDIIIVTGYTKRAIEDHFDRNPDLENYLATNSKTELLEDCQRIAEMANFIYLRQRRGYGNGVPVLTAKHLIAKDEAFAVLWGDEFIYSDPPRLQQMMKIYDKYRNPVISAVKIPKKEDLSKYGIAKVKKIENNVYQILSIAEKPEPSKAPSDLATHGAYILTPEVFSILENLKPGKGGEIWLVDAINELMKRHPIYACEIKNGKYYDCGNKVEYLKAQVDFAIQRHDINSEFKKYLKELHLK